MVFPRLIELQLPVVSPPWVSPQGGCHANYVGTCGGDTCRGDIAELEALIVEAVPEAGVPPFRVVPEPGVPNGTIWA